MTEPAHISTAPASRYGLEDIEPDPDGLCHCPAGPLNTTPIGMCLACYRLVIDRPTPEGFAEVDQ